MPSSALAILQVFWNGIGLKWLYEKWINGYYSLMKPPVATWSPPDLLLVWPTIDISKAYLSLTHEASAANTGDFHSNTDVAGPFGLIDFAFRDAVNRRDARLRKECGFPLMNAAFAVRGARGPVACMTVEYCALSAAAPYHTRACCLSPACSLMYRQVAGNALWPVGLKGNLAVDSFGILDFGSSNAYSVAHMTYWPAALALI